MTFRSSFFTLIILVCLFTTAFAQPFIHPGLLQSQEDLDRMKLAVAAKQQPIYSGFEIFQQHLQSQKTYKMQGPLAMVGRNPTVGQGTYDNDANAAYQCALMWAITGDIAYANKAKEIINSWSLTLKSITGKDAVLMASLGPLKMVNAAEILRYTNSSWSAAEIRQTEKHFIEVIYPVIKDFSPFANGNWDTAALKTVLSIAVFCNDRAMFEHGLRYYVDGAGDGRLTHYIINEDGQCQESGRDQGHTQLGLAHLGDCAEIAWHQGLDLYAYHDNLLLKGFEYTAKYNLGNDVPFVPTLDRTGKYAHKQLSIITRGQLRPVYEQIYNHYVNRAGLSAPFTTAAAEKIRPEKQGQPGADHPGFGTLLYSIPKPDSKSSSVNIPVSPGAIIAKSTSREINLTWIKSRFANSYTIKRSVKKGGPYKIIARNIGNTAYTDSKVKKGTTYYYSLSASNTTGESANSYETGISFGLPDEWNHRDVGNANVAGNTSFDGSQFRIEGSGINNLNHADGFHFAYTLLNGDGSITIRYVPQISSQFTKFGLMFRNDLSADAPQVSLLLWPEHGAQIEAPQWNVRLIAREIKGTSTSVKTGSENFVDPVVTNGRLTGNFWLKLERKGNLFTGYSSVDGQIWTTIGSTIIVLPENTFIGIPVSSGIDTISTIVTLDHVKIN